MSASSVQQEADPRARYFTEAGDCTSPFPQASWRGCCLNRDRFDATMMPRFLFEALMAATGSREISVNFYTPEQAPAVGVAADWASFRDVVSRPVNQSLEHVLSDNSGAWAVLCELDVVVLGASSEIAARIDAELEQHGTSLKQMTVWDFPDLLSSDPRHAYMRAVVGPGLAGAPQ